MNTHVETKLFKTQDKATIEPTVVKDPRRALRTGIGSVWSVDK